MRRAEQTAELYVDEGDPTGEQVGCGRRPSPIAGPEWLSRSDWTVLPPLAGGLSRSDWGWSPVVAIILCGPTRIHILPNYRSRVRWQRRPRVRHLILIIAAAPMLAQPQVFVQQAIDALLHVPELVTGQQQRPGGHRREG